MKLRAQRDSAAGHISQFARYLPAASRQRLLLGRSETYSFTARPYPRTGGGVLQDRRLRRIAAVLSLVTKPGAQRNLGPLASRWSCCGATQRRAPDPENRITLRKQRIRIHNLANNLEAHDRLVYRWLDTLQAVERTPDPGGQESLGSIPVARRRCGDGLMPAAPAGWASDRHLRVGLTARSHEWAT